MGGERRLRNYSIDYFKYFCALLVTAVHIKPFLAVSEQVNTIVTNVLPRIAVPFFFIVSGYFFAEKLYSGKKPLKKFALKILAVYSFWSFVYGIRLTIIAAKNHSLGLIFFEKLLRNYLFFGVSEHLWYCLSLLFALCLLTLLFRLNIQEKIPAFAGIISGAAYGFSLLVITYYSKLGKYIPFVRGFRSLPYFFGWFRLFFFGTSFVFLGAFAYRYRSRITKNNRRRVRVLTGVFAALYLGEKVINILCKNNLLINITLYPLILFILLFLLTNPSSKETRFSPYARNAATFTYYSHPLFMAIIGLAVKFQPALWLMVMAVTLALSILLTGLNNKRLNYILL